MESNSLSRRAGLEEKVPELERTLGMVDMLILKKEGGEGSWETSFELSDTLYARAEVEEGDEVYIWLGVGLSTLCPFCFIGALSG